MHNGYKNRNTYRLAHWLNTDPSIRRKIEVYCENRAHTQSVISYKDFINQQYLNGYNPEPGLSVFARGIDREALTSLILEIGTCY